VGGAYIIKATDMQNTNSTQNQIENCREFVVSNGWQVLEAFEDVGISGATRKRLGYQKMPKSVKSELVDFVVAEGLSRLNRNQELSANLRHIALKAGISRSLGCSALAMKARKRFQRLLRATFGPIRCRPVQCC